MEAEARTHAAIIAAEYARLTPSKHPEVRSDDGDEIARRVRDVDTAVGDSADPSMVAQGVLDDGRVEPDGSGPQLQELIASPAVAGEGLRHDWSICDPTCERCHSYRDEAALNSTPTSPPAARLTKPEELP